LRTRNPHLICLRPLQTGQNTLNLSNPNSRLASDSWVIMLKYIFTVALCTMLTASIANAVTIEPLTVTTIEVKELTIDQKITKYANQYGVNPQSITKTIECESRFKETAYNASDPYGGAFGVAQFLKPTFYYYAKIVRIENPDIWNTDQQLEIMSYMFSIGQAKQWTCARNLKLV